ncbi:MAG: preprotein translocase subunit SecG [Bacteroidales bacterium]|nr:preprotein translocase subunit SecG [Bacteroidales bacterium]
MYTLFSVLILIVCILLILIVLVQNPKGGGLASNFSGSNQIMGVRRTADFLEKSTWTLAVSLVVLAFLATLTMPSKTVVEQKSVLETKMKDTPSGNALPDFATPADGAAAQDSVK